MGDPLKEEEEKALLQGLEQSEEDLLKKISAKKNIQQSIEIDENAIKSLFYDSKNDAYPTSLAKLKTVGEKLKSLNMEEVQKKVKEFIGKKDTTVCHLIKPNSKIPWQNSAMYTCFDEDQGRTIVYGSIKDEEKKIHFNYRGQILELDTDNSLKSVVYEITGNNRGYNYDSLPPRNAYRAGVLKASNVYLKSFYAKWGFKGIEINNPIYYPNWCTPSCDPDMAKLLYFDPFVKVFQSCFFVDGGEDCTNRANKLKEKITTLMSAVWEIIGDYFNGTSLGDIRTYYDPDEHPQRTAGPAFWGRIMQSTALKSASNIGIRKLAEALVFPFYQMVNSYHKALKEAIKKTHPGALSYQLFQASVTTKQGSRGLKAFKDEVDKIDYSKITFQGKNLKTAVGMLEHMGPMPFVGFALNYATATSISAQGFSMVTLVRESRLMNNPFHKLLSRIPIFQTQGNFAVYKCTSAKKFAQWKQLKLTGADLVTYFLRYPILVEESGRGTCYRPNLTMSAIFNAFLSPNHNKKSSVHIHYQIEIRPNEYSSLAALVSELLKAGPGDKWGTLPAAQAIWAKIGVPSNLMTELNLALNYTNPSFDRVDAYFYPNKAQALKPNEVFTFNGEGI